MNYENIELIFGFKPFIDSREDLNYLLLINNVNTISIIKKKNKIVCIFLGEIVGSPSSLTIKAFLTKEERKEFGNSREILTNFAFGIKQNNLEILEKYVKKAKSRSKDKKFEDFEGYLLKRRATVSSSEVFNKKTSLNDFSNLTKSQQLKTK